MEAMLYQKLEGGRVRCALCAQRCSIPDGQRGICGVRENRSGVLYTLVYGQAIAEAVDPIEKKPLFHFYPGSTALSIATAGCNFRCTFCQNADISQLPRDHGGIAGHFLSPQAVVADAERNACRSIAYTYTEPTIFFEYAYDTGRLAHAAGVANVYVSNGYMTSEMLDLAAPVGEPPLIDAANIDLKAFRDSFYRRACGASLQPVLDSLVRLRERGVWLEVTTLIIPGLNDSDEELRDIAGFLVDKLGADTPWHVSRFHPTYKLTDRPPTPPTTVMRARNIGLEAGLRYVYVGNIPGSDGENTSCPGCGRIVIQRMGFRVLHNDAQGGTCRHCGTPLAGVGL
ncbi:MAG: AmmeMemoRadiSam system radical SAM enzyme [Anaerolineae bacterium]